MKDQGNVLTLKGVRPGKVLVIKGEKKQRKVLGVMQMEGALDKL